MKILICGEAPRQKAPWSNALRSRYVFAVVDWIQDAIREGRIRADRDVIIEGGAPGVDVIARDVLQNRGYRVIEVPAEWKKYGKAAGPRRNSKMLAMEPDLVVAFHRNLKASRGTADTVQKAMGLGIKTEVVTVEVR